MQDKRNVLDPPVESSIAAQVEATHDSHNQAAHEMRSDWNIEPTVNM